MKLGHEGRVSTCIQGTLLTVQDGARGGKGRELAAGWEPEAPSPHTTCLGGVPQGI